MFRSFRLSFSVLADNVVVFCIILELKSLIFDVLASILDFLIFILKLLVLGLEIRFLVSRKNGVSAKNFGITWFSFNFIDLIYEGSAMVLDFLL